MLIPGPYLSLICILKKKTREREWRNFLERHFFIRALLFELRNLILKFNIKCFNFEILLVRDTKASSYEMGFVRFQFDFSMLPVVKKIGVKSYPAGCDSPFCLVPDKKLNCAYAIRPLDSFEIRLARRQQ